VGRWEGEKGKVLVECNGEFICFDGKGRRESRFVENGAKERAVGGEH
jgi:hypothetical protein